MDAPNISITDTTANLQLASPIPATQEAYSYETEVSFDLHQQLISRVETELVFKLESFRLWIATQSFSANTLRVYDSRARQFIAFVQGLDLTGAPTHSGEALFQFCFNEFLNQQKNIQNLRSHSLNNYIRFARMFARHNGWQDSYSWESPVSADGADANEEADLRLYLETLKFFASPRDKALVLLLVLCRCPIEEILSLRADQVEISNEALHLVRKSGIKRIALPADLRPFAHECIRQWVDTVRQTKFSPELLLFPGDNDRPLSRTAADFAVRKFGWKCGKSVNLRMLRYAVFNHHAASVAEINQQV